MKYLIAFFLIMFAPSCVSAGCLAASQNAIAAVQIVNAQAISEYGWQGDPWYDQVLPWCGAHPGFREYGCNVVANIAIRLLEDKTLGKLDRAGGSVGGKNIYRATCVLNYIGAAAFLYWTRDADTKQVFLPLGRDAQHIGMSLVHWRF